MTDINAGSVRGEFKFDIAKAIADLQAAIKGVNELTTKTKEAEKEAEKEAQAVSEQGKKTEEAGKKAEEAGKKIDEAGKKTEGAGKKAEEAGLQWGHRFISVETLKWDGGPTDLVPASMGPPIYIGGNRVSKCLIT